MKKYYKSIGFYLILLVVFLAVASFLLRNQSNKDDIKYSDVIGYFEQAQVREFTIDGNVLYYWMENDENPHAFKLMSVGKFFDDVGDEIDEQRKAGKLTYQLEAPTEVPWWVSLVPYLVLIVVVVLVWLYINNQVNNAGGGGKAMNFSKARVKMGADEKKKVTFADVAGEDEEKEELQEVVDFLKNPRKYMELGARIPKGILLVGPPGTGKTLLAKAVAGEAGVPFFSISGSDFVEMFVGVGASRVRDLFDQSKKNAPCIVFIDEIDAVGRHRGAGLGGGHDEREQTLNQLLVEMDGFGVNEGVIIIAATNRPDILDPALLRPGRFDRQITVGYPDIKGREAILKVHAKGKPLAAEVSLATIAKTTAGFTGADLENLLNEAALLAARRNAKEIYQPDIEEAMIKVVAGPQKRSRVISDKEKKLTAYHESGHAIVGRNLPTQDPVHQVSIIPRGSMGGYTMHLPQEDKSYMTKQEMFEEIVSLLGGRVAEQLILGDISNGASNDIQRATAIAKNMVTKYGMSDRLGPIVFGTGHDEVFLGKDFGSTRDYSETVATEIDEEVHTIIEDAYQKAEQILTDNMAMLHKLAGYLIINEQIDAADFAAMFGDPVPEEEKPAEAAAEKAEEQPAEAEKASDEKPSGDSEN